MAKHLDNAVVYLLCVVIGILGVLLFFLVLKFYKQEGDFKHTRRETEKDALVLRDEREKLERLLRTVKTTEKGEE